MGAPLDGSQRLAHLLAAQRVLGSSSRAVLLFDEMEDALPEEPLSFCRTKSTTTKAKRWVHTILETKAVPIVWRTNSAAHVDAATLRRFQLVIEVPLPPRRTRRRILERAFAGIAVEAAWVDDLADGTSVTPGEAMKLARVARLARLVKPAETAKLLTSVLEASRRLVEPASARARRSARVGRDLALVNADTPLADVAAQLGSAEHATVLLVGPPGTGKTTFVDELEYHQYVIAQ